MKTLAFYNLKGGVGKTTSAVNFAYLAAQEGHRTLLWDLDAQGAATFYLRISPMLKTKARKLLENKKQVKRVIKATAYPNLDLLPADITMRHLDMLLGDVKKGVKRLSKLVQKLAPRYAYVFFDCPASLSFLSESVFQASDYLVMPVIPTTLSLQTFQQVQRHLLKHFTTKPQLVPFFSMVDRRKSLHRKTISDNSSGNLFCKSFIPTRSIIERMGVYHAPLLSFSQDSKATGEYKALWEEIKTRLS